MGYSQPQEALILKRRHAANTILQDALSTPLPPDGTAVPDVTLCAVHFRTLARVGLLDGCGDEEEPALHATVQYSRFSPGCHRGFSPRMHP